MARLYVRRQARRTASDADLTECAPPRAGRAKIKAGQAATATALRTLADRIEALPLTSAGEVLAWISPYTESLHREAERILGAQP